MGAPVMGKTSVGWCSACNVPIIGRTCGRCEAKPLTIGLTPPADTRPAFPWDIDHMNGFFSRTYGAEMLTKDRVAVLSSTAGFEYAYEVVADGKKLCIMATDIDGREFCKLYLAGAQRLADGGARGWVRIEKDVVRFLEHGDLLRPGVEDADSTIRKGDEVFIAVDGRVVATGTARMDGPDMVTRERGVAVKVRRFGSGDGGRLSPSTWEDAVVANERRTDELERRAVAFMRKTVKKHKGHPLVAMSGGKDSAVTLALATKALDDFAVIFIDTGLEFPETVANVHEACEALGLTERLHIASAGDGFWRSLTTFGPPAMDYRWCCKVAKLGPVSRAISEKWGSTLTFGGERKYESFSRASRPPVDRNPWVPNQLSAYPILNWTGLDVWLYLMRENVPVNTLYHQGHERVGCWVCPSSSAWGFKRLAETHPDLARKWDDVIHSHAKKHGLSDEWVRGEWRRHGHGEEGGQRDVVTFNILTGDEDGFLATILGYEDTHLLSILGDVARGERTVISSHKGQVAIAPDGSCVVSGSEMTQERAEELLERVCKIILRERSCTGCGICASACSRQALAFNGRLMLDEKACIRCGTCLAQPCPLDFLGRRERVS